MPRFFWGVLAGVGLSLVYLGLQVVLVRPYLWPAGHGAVLHDDAPFAGSTSKTMLLARPPDVHHGPHVDLFVDVRPGSAASLANLGPGARLHAAIKPSTGARVELPPELMHDSAALVRAWRDAYRLGLSGPIIVDVSDTAGARREIRLDRPPAWAIDSDGMSLWVQRHLPMLLQILVFIGSACALLVFRSTDPTAALAIAALALCAAGGGGPLLGSEEILPAGARQAMTIAAWLATPFAFPLTGLAILYFPQKAPILVRRPWLLVLPFALAAPMIVLGTLTALYLAGADWALRAAVWDAEHPTVYYSSSAAALAFNVWTVIEGIRRYRANIDADERRRIRLAVWTTIPAVFAYALKDGLPLAYRLVAGPGPALELPWWIVWPLHFVVLLPAFGVTYAVAVHRVFGPRLFLRAGVRYALARRTLTVLAALPVAALAISLVLNRGMTLEMIVRGNARFLIVTTVLVLAVLRYREAATGWLDRRFFRDQYDARAILTSLASRVPYETDPNELSAMVVDQIDQALHPETIAILASGIQDGVLSPVAVVRGDTPPLAIEGGLMTMMRWSDEPLEIDLKDARSPVSRLPSSEREWIARSGAVLLVPITTPSGQDRATTGLIALGRKRSEEPYTREDRSVLASIASQVGLALDVVRLRRRALDPLGVTAVLTSADEAAGWVVECPACGRCEEMSVPICPADGTPMAAVTPIPRVIDQKYRLDRLLGRGGMGAVYRAHDLRLDRDVALKVVRPELLIDPDARTRFRREAQIVARLQHPGVVSVFDYGTLPDGAAYLVMEFVRGQDLRHALKQAGRFAPPDAIRLMTAACAAIDAAHRNGVLHRDLKPENILLPEHGDGVKVLDFGVAKILSADDTAASERHQTLTLQGQVIGTPAYMAPEQLRGGAVDARTDIFSLGVIAFEMLTGDLPFGRGSVVDIAMRQSRGTPPLVAGNGPVPPPLARAVRMALEMDPQRRFETAAAFAGALETTRQG